MTVSVIIPVYNGKKYLAECLDSVINQTHTNLEIIIIDDGSTDGSAEIYNKYAGQDSRIKAIRQDNSGLSAARNTGLDAAKGRYIHFMDATGLIPNDYYEKMLTPSFVNTDAEMSAGGVYGNNLVDKSYIFEKEDVLQDNEDKLFWGLKHLGTVWRFLFKREFIENYKLRFNKKIKLACGEHILFVIQAVYYANKIILAPGCMYFYKYHPDGFTQLQDRTAKYIRAANTLYAKRLLFQFGKKHGINYLWFTDWVRHAFAKDVKYAE